MSCCDPQFFHGRFSWQGDILTLLCVFFSHLDSGCTSGGVYVRWIYLHASELLQAAQVFVGVFV